MHRLLPTVFSVIFLSCGRTSTVETAQEYESSAIRTGIEELQMPAEDDRRTQVTGADTTILFEKTLNGLVLPFPRKEMLSVLKEKFPGFTVTKATGQQDGPDYALYLIMQGDVGICSFAMDADDSLKLDRIYIERPAIKDEYGLSVGDPFERIKASRKGTLKIHTHPTINIPLFTMTIPTSCMRSPGTFRYRILQTLTNSNLQRNRSKTGRLTMPSGEQQDPAHLEQPHRNGRFLWRKILYFTTIIGNQSP